MRTSLYNKAAIITIEAARVSLIEDEQELLHVMQLLYNSGYIAFIDECVGGKHGFYAQVRAELIKQEIIERLSRA